MCKDPELKISAPAAGRCEDISQRKWILVLGTHLMSSASWQGRRAHLCPRPRGWGNGLCWVMLQGPQLQNLRLTGDGGRERDGSAAALGSASMPRVRPAKCTRNSQIKLVSKTPCKARSWALESGLTSCPCCAPRVVCLTVRDLRFAGN